MAFHGRLSPKAVDGRFFIAHPCLSTAEVEHYTHVDYHDRLALVAEHSDGVVAVARYDRVPGTGDAEVAFVVSDAHQGRGLGTLLLENVVLRAGRLAEDNPELTELDLNPVVAGPGGSLVLDVKIRLAVPLRRPDPWERRVP